MCDFAAHLRENVMPRAPVRQWVLTVPHGLRFSMAFNPDLTGLVLRTFVSVVSRWLRRRARAVGIGGLLKTGGVTVIQRFGSALNLNVHFHTLMIDGVYELRLVGQPISHPVPAPTDNEVAAIAGAVVRKVGKKLAGLDDVAEDAAVASEPLLAGLASASVAGVVATGARRGARVGRLVGPGLSGEATIVGRRCALVGNTPPGRINRASSAYPSHFLLTRFTNYRQGTIRIIPFRAHAFIELGEGVIVLGAAGLLFGQPIMARFFLALMGASQLVAFSFSDYADTPPTA
jgi:hypothetical protein